MRANPVTETQLNIRTAGDDSSGEPAQRNGHLRVYLPPQALQGQDLPFFALWKAVTFRKIEVLFPSELEIDEIYNVARNEYTVEPGQLIVEKVEVDGYLGISFSSRRFRTTSEQVCVVSDFHEASGEVYSRRCNIHLFRPLLAAKEIPRSIRVSVSRCQPLDFIQVANEGTGTIRMVVISEEDSDLRITESAAMSDFRKNLRRDLDTGFADLAGAFPEQADLVEKLKEVWLRRVDLEDEEELVRVKSVAGSLQDAIVNDEKFGRALAETFAGALLKNLTLFNLLEQLVDYFHSVPAKKVLMINPLDIIEVGPKPAVLKVKLLYTDLANGHYEPVHVLTRLVAKRRCSLPVYRLLQWGRGG